MNNARNQDMEAVIAEVERSLEQMQSNYLRVVTNLVELKAKMNKDDLTQLLRRGPFMARFNELLLSSKKEGREVNLIMVDLDHFKKVNDTYGHQTGDAVLQRVSELISNYMRPGDLAGRFGGEEIILAIQGSMSQAAGLAENIRRAVAESRIRAAGSNEAELQVTLSMGVASTQVFEFEAERLIGEADAALYRAKRSGRNRVSVASVRAVVELKAA